MKKNCDTCEFQFYGENGICAAKHYGMPMEEVKKLEPDGCEEWGMSLEEYIRQEEEKRKNKNKKYRF